MTQEDVKVGMRVRIPAFPKRNLVIEMAKVQKAGYVQCFYENDVGEIKREIFPIEMLEPIKTNIGVIRTGKIIRNKNHF